MILILQSTLIELFHFRRKNMKALLITLLNCFILVVSFVFHRLMIRFFNLPIDNFVVYWGSLIIIFGVINLVTTLIITPKR